MHLDDRYSLGGIPAGVPKKARKKVIDARHHMRNRPGRAINSMQEQFRRKVLAIYNHFPYGVANEPPYDALPSDDWNGGRYVFEPMEYDRFKAKVEQLYSQEDKRCELLGIPIYVGKPRPEPGVIDDRAEIDHIRSGSLYPENFFDPNNIRWLSAVANRGRGNRSDEQYRQRVSFLHEQLNERGNTSHKKPCSN